MLYSQNFTPSVHVNTIKALGWRALTLKHHTPSNLNRVSINVLGAAAETQH